MGSNAYAYAVFLMNILFVNKSLTPSCIVFQLLAHKQKKTVFYSLTFFQVLETYSITIILLSLSQQKKNLSQSMKALSDIY